LSSPHLCQSCQSRKSRKPSKLSRQKPPSSRNHSLASHTTQKCRTQRDSLCSIATHTESAINRHNIHPMPHTHQPLVPFFTTFTTCILTTSNSSNTSRQVNLINQPSTTCHRTISILLSSRQTLTHPQRQLDRPCARALRDFPRIHLNFMTPPF
jgi:hypothetical protein